MGKFAASFVRINAYPAPELTEILRAKRMEGVTVNVAAPAPGGFPRAGN